MQGPFSHNLVVWGGHHSPSSRVSQWLKWRKFHTVSHVLGRAESKDLDVHMTDEDRRMVFVPYESVTRRIRDTR